jgi:c-di-GMP-binding flagellar brake protein YcgR
MRVGSDSPESGPRRRVTRIRANLRVVLAFRDGDKQPARVIDISTGGMNLRAARIPEYGESVTVVVQLRESSEWFLLPAVVRWFGRESFGVAFSELDPAQARALAIFIDQAAA